MRYRQTASLAVLVVLSLVVAGCAASRAYGRGERLARAGDWDAAVVEYRRAVQEDPSRVDYQIALERAMLNASIRHLDQARLLEARGQLEDALREYRRASEYDPTNRQIAARVLEMERRLRDLAEAQRPTPTVQQLQQQVPMSPEPLLNPASNEPADWVYSNASLRDILTTMGMATGINVTFERDYQDRTYSITLRGATFLEALNHILQSNQLFYKVINQNTIMVIPDNAQKRLAYEEQVIRTFFLSHADATELTTLLNGIIRIPQLAVVPAIVPNKTNNTITVRATSNIVAIIEKIIQQNDTPRAEVIVDVQILEVNRNRAKMFGIDLSQFAISGAFSPEADPRPADGDADAPALTPRPFNLNTVTRGISTADFYLSVPSAVVRFLESDSETRLVAKPQLRGAEGQQITLNLGDRIPVPSTVFTPIAQGGANTNPLTSINYVDVGVNVQITSRVTFDGEILMDLVVENLSLGQDRNVAGTLAPSFGQRRVATRLRLRDGESNLLAGLLREDERRSLRGIPGIANIPLLRTLFAANDREVAQTDIVMLLTPRIVRTQELTVDDVAPIFIGSQQSIGLTGAPQQIGVPPQPEPAPAAPAAQPGDGVIVVPPGSSPVPGTTTVPAAPAQPPAQPVPPAGGAGSAAVPATGAAPQAGGAPPVQTPATVASGGQILLSPPGIDFRVGGGPYTVPISIAGAQRLSSVTLTITFNPAVLRVRTIQEGAFMRTGGVMATFTQQVDTTTGRIDIAIVRPGDVTGVSGSGLLAAVLVDAVGEGAANLTVTGSATDPRGLPVTLQFAAPPGVTVR